MIEGLKLEPCPFCGNALEVTQRRYNPHARCVTENCKGAQLPLLNIELPNDVARWNRRAIPSRQVDETGRSASDYAIEHAEYMAQSAEHVSAVFEKYGMAIIAAEQGEDDTDELHESVDEALASLKEALADLRGYAYEFRKRRDRATHPAQAAS